MLKVLCIGDSNTWGYDPQSYFGSRYPSGIPWTDRLDGLQVINYGINGLSIPGDALPFKDLIRSKSPDLAAVMLGTNDLLQGRSADETAARMGRFLTDIREPGSRILLIAPPPLQSGDWVQSEAMIEESRKLAGLYRALAGKEGIFFSDAGEWNVELNFDGVHFSAAGHAAFAERFRTEVEELASVPDVSPAGPKKRRTSKSAAELRKITEKNFLDAFNLRLAPEQERFVSHPVRSLAQAYVYRDQCQPFGIYAEGKMIGYVMVIYDYDIPEYDIWHMMIDESMQGRGYGSKALDRVIEYIRTKPFGDSNRVALTCHKENTAAEKLYESKGFSPTGTEYEDEIELAMTIGK